jgi:glycosyltransferase involved in cell wall biosynthesis
VKVLVIGHPLVVSANRTVWNLVGKEDDVDVDMIVPKTWKSNLIRKLEFSPDVETDNYVNQIYPVTCFYKGNGSFYIFNPFKILKILNIQKYDAIVLTQETWSFSLLEVSILRLFTKNRNSKFFLWVCQNIKKQKLYFLRFFERFNTRSLEAILCCCSEIKEVIDWKQISTKCQYFPFSFDANKYSSEIQVIKSHSESKITLGYLGRISEEKGIDLMLALVDKLHSDGIDVNLVVAGAGPLEHILRDNPRVKFLGSIPHNEAYKFYEEIDAFILPSQTRTFWKEQFGRVIIESIASGKPVVGSSSGAIPEVLGNLKMPYVFQEDSLDDFGKQVRNVLADIKSGRINEIIQESKKLSFELYSHDSVAQRFLSYARNEDKFEDL